MLDKKPHRLNVSGNRLELYEYTLQRTEDDENHEMIYQFTVEPEALFAREDWNVRHYNGIHVYTKWKKGLNAFQKVVDYFFYTFVSNYSMYAYNREDYSDEFDADGIGCWLQGIFHKNDGYQTPIVLTPFREKGNIFCITSLFAKKS